MVLPPGLIKLSIDVVRSSIESTLSFPSGESQGQSDQFDVVYKIDLMRRRVLLIDFRNLVADGCLWSCAEDHCA